MPMLLIKMGVSLFYDVQYISSKNCSIVFLHSFFYNRTNFSIIFFTKHKSRLWETDLDFYVLKNLAKPFMFLWYAYDFGSIRWCAYDLFSMCFLHNVLHITFFQIVIENINRKIWTYIFTPIFFIRSSKF